MWYAYDVETYPNFFSVTFIDITWKNFDRYVEADIDKDRVTKERLIQEGVDSNSVFIYKDIGQEDFIIEDLVDFLKNNVKVLFGYNNHEYDDLMLDFILAHRVELQNNSLIRSITIYETNESIIEYSNSYLSRQVLKIPKESSFLAKNSIESVDLMSLHYLNKLKIGLKQIAIVMQWHRIQDLPIPPGTFILDEQHDDIIDYNINDVLITIKLFNYGIDEFKLRLHINKTHNINVSSDARSKVGDKIFTKLYEKATGTDKRTFRYKKTERRSVRLAEIITPTITFETKQLQELLETLKTKTIRIGVDNSKTELGEEVIIGTSKFVVKLGGLHGKDTPDIFNTTKNYKLIDADVGSFYPNLIINHNICPEHLDTLAFIATLTFMTKERIKFKSDGDKFNADAMKIALNNIYGKLGFEFGYLFDLKAMYATTINGQLYILKLVEMIYLAGFNVLSANTDGVVTQVPPDREDEYKAVCIKWATIYNFTLDFVYYKKYIRQSVNDYISLTSTGKIKAKGVLNPELDLTKGYYAPIIKKATIDFLLYNKDVDETLHNHDNIYDFCISQKVGSQFRIEAHKIVGNEIDMKPLQKNIRYFVSTDGITLVKRYMVNTSTTGVSNKGKTVSLVAKVRCTPFNDFFRVESMKDYNVDYNFYKRKVFEIIYKVNKADMKDIRKGISGTMFNDIYD